MANTPDMTSSFIHGSADIRKTLHSYVDSSQKTAIAIAFWGKGACEAIGIFKSKPGLRILLNATSGACNPSELEAMLDCKATVEVRSDPRLHAKVALCGNRTLIGSANASANGLGFEGESATCWHEACSEITDEIVSLDSWIWFEHLWTGARDLDQDLIHEAKKAWKITRKAARAREPLGAGDRISPYSVAELPIFVVLNCEESDYDEKDAKQQAKKRGLDLGRIDFYQSWPKIPTQSLLLSYDFDKRTQKITADNSFKTFESNRAIQLKSGGRIYPVEIADANVWLDFGIKKPSSLKSLKSSVAGLGSFFKENPHKLRTFREERTFFSSPYNWCIRLDEFLAACADASIPLPEPFSAT